jgi:hypothetical protein
LTAHRYLRRRQDAKGKSVFSSDSKLTPYQDWNESKKSSWQCDNMPILVRGRALLIAASTSGIASTSATAIAATGVTRTGLRGPGGMVGCGMVAAAPAEMASVAGAENARTVRSETVGRQPAISSAVSRLDYQYVTNQRRAADRDGEYHHAVQHRFSGSKREIAPACALQKGPRSSRHL